MIGSIRRLLGRTGEGQQSRRDWKAEGNSFLAAGDLAQAIRCYRCAVDADVVDAAARLNLGFALLEQGSIEEARHWLREVLQLQPAYHEAHFLLARAARAQGRLEEAAQSYADAARHDPAFEPARAEGCEVCLELGQRELDTGRREAARAWFDRALALQPGHPQTLFGMGNVLMQGNEPAAAAALHAQVLEAMPDHLGARLHLAQALQQAGREDEALAAYERAFAAYPDPALAAFGRGNALQSMRRLEDATQSFRQAVQLRPGFVEALVNLGGVLQIQKRFAEAVQAYDEALVHEPDNAPAHWSRSLCLLVQGEFEAGWREAEWRFDALGMKRLRSSRPQWTGAEPLAGKTLLVHAEQGFGDTLQFCRYVPLLAQRGANVILGVQKPLESLMRTLPGPFRLLETGQPIPPHDYHCPLLSLSLAFGTALDSIPANAPYLASRPELVAQWRERLGPAGPRRVGIVWSGNAKQANDHNRSMPLASLLPIAGPGVQLVSLQKEVRPGDQAALEAAGITHFGDALTDFEQTAALIECMDVVVSVCTSVAHLAGALGKPLWVVLAFNADWRWLLDRTDSPWYPSARLFRQESLGDWGPVVAAVREELQKL